MSFDGFPKETFEFLMDIRSNNTKDWFDANRSRYGDYWVAPARSFVEEMGEALLDVAPGIIAEPKINGSIRRINRDTRFSKDKTPYKDHLDIGFPEGDKKQFHSGFWVRITGDGVGTGIGQHGFSKELLPRYRDAVVDPKKGASLANAIAAVEKAGFEARGEHYKRVPKGYEPANETQARMLKFASLWTGEDKKLPKVIHSAEFIEYCIDQWTPQLPLHRWLVDELR